MTITPSDTHNRKDDSLLLDVRTPAEYAEAHIEGSVLHPLTGLSPEKVRQLASGKQACILVCRSGNRAKQAAEKLKAHERPAAPANP